MQALTFKLYGLTSMCVDWLVQKVACPMQTDRFPRSLSYYEKKTMIKRILTSKIFLLWWDDEQHRGGTGGYSSVLLLLQYELRTSSPHHYWWYSRILVTTLKVRSASIHSRQKLLPFHNYFRNFKHLKFQISDIMIQTESIV